MDQQFLEREKELFKLNAKLNAKTKKIQVIASTKSQAKIVQIHTANNNFNYYEDGSPACPSQKESHDDGLELLCKRINISNQPVKKPQEIVYPLFNRQTVKAFRRANLDIHIHMPPDAKIDQEDSTDIKSETIESFKNESMLTRFSDDSSAIPPADPVPNMPLPPPPNLCDIIPRSMDKKNISNDGLMKWVKHRDFHLNFHLNLQISEVKSRASADGTRGWEEPQRHPREGKLEALEEDQKAYDTGW